MLERISGSKRPVVDNSKNPLRDNPTVFRRNGAVEGLPEGKGVRIWSYEELKAHFTDNPKGCKAIELVEKRHNQPTIFRKMLRNENNSNMNAYFQVNKAMIDEAIRRKEKK